MYNGNANITICDHPLIKHKLTMIRQKTTGTNEFRTIVAELAMLIGYLLNLPKGFPPPLSRTKERL